MGDKSDSTTIVRRINPPKTKHLKPLSVFSQMVMCDQNGSPHLPKEPPTPFINFKIKVVNDGGSKRKLIEYDMDDNNNTPCKTQCGSNAMSPDLGFFTDSSSSPSGNYSTSPFAPPYPVLNEEIQALKSKIKETLSSRLDMDHVQCRCSKDEVKKTVRSGTPVFDHNVDDILCINLRKQDVQEPKDGEKHDAGVGEDDKGYVSLFHLQDNEECKTESPPAQQRHKRASPCGQQFSFLTKDDTKALSGLLLGPVKSDGDFLGGEDEVFNIGQPLFESSMCQSAALVEEKSVTSEAKEPLHVSQTYNSGDFTMDTLYETTLPLEVKVKSKVIVPNQPERKPASSVQPEEGASSACLNKDQGVQGVRVHRPEIFDTTMEWERQKRQYILSVRSHMNENPGEDQGPMSELLDLMTHVAGQGALNGCEWLHPSDLTCRNYQKRFGNQAPTMTLSEWQAHNQTHYRRFSKVPKIFKRSPFP